MTWADVTGWIGLTPPTPDDVVPLAIAGGLLMIAAALSALIARRLGPRLATWLNGTGDEAPGPLARGAGVIAGALAAVLFLAIASAAWVAPPWAALVLAFGLALAAARGAYALTLGLRLGRFVAWGMGLLIFAMLFSGRVAGIQALEKRLSAIGFDIGSTRWSLLTLVHIVIAAIVLYAFVRIANRVVRRVTTSNTSLDDAQRLLIQKIAAVAIVIGAFFVAIDMLGIDLTAFAVFSGAFGLAIGFGLQKTFGNLIAGIILLMDRSIKPGDVIVVGDAVGRVNKIGVRAVSVITRDGKEHLVPNELLMTERVENWSYSSRDVRVRVAVGVAYDADVRLAQRLMLEAARESPRVLDYPEPVAWITAFGDSSIDHELRFWIRDPEGGLGNVQGDVFLRILDKFREAGVEIPYPQRDVRVRSWPAPPPE